MEQVQRKIHFCTAVMGEQEQHTAEAAGFPLLVIRGPHWRGRAKAGAISGMGSFNYSVPRAQSTKRLRKSLCVASYTTKEV